VSEEGAVLGIVDLSKATFMSKPVTSGSATFSVPALPSGTYVITTEEGPETYASTFVVG